MKSRKLVVPIEKRHWPRPALYKAGTFSVAGVVFRKENALNFAKGVFRSDEQNLSYGLHAVRDPKNSHDPNAVKLFGWWMTRGWFGGTRQRKTFIGYLPADIASDVVAAYGPDRNPDIALYSVYVGHDDFIDVKGIVLRP